MIQIKWILKLKWKAYKKVNQKWYNLKIYKINKNNDNEYGNKNEYKNGNKINNNEYKKWKWNKIWIEIWMKMK